jgi:hypothetical protein
MTDAPPPIRRRGIQNPQQPGLTSQDTEHLPLDADFQGVLIKMLLEDHDLAAGLGGHLHPTFFASPVHRWAWDYCLRYKQDIGGYPTLNFLVSSAGQMPGSGPLFSATLAQIRDRPITDEVAVRTQAVDFIRRSVFKRAVLDSKDLFNAGKYGAAYDLMKERMGVLDAVSIEPVSRAWFSEEFVSRHIERQDPTYQASAIATGIPPLDGRPPQGVLDGGLHLGELGLWIAYPKAGKTTMLINLGAVAVRTQRKRTLHIVLEGSLSYVEARYDSVFTGELYVNVKRGEVDAQKYARAFAEMQELRRMLVIRDFTKTGDANITHVDGELRDLARGFGFQPELIVLDYVDLLQAKYRYEREVEAAKAAMQDLKNLANRGYAVWSASQVQRPTDDEYQHRQHTLVSKNIADCYAKVRIADFVGSINQTVAEREQGVMRLFAELYRDGPSGVNIQINTDFTTMTFSGGSAVVTPAPGPERSTDASVQATKPMLYKTGGYQQKRGVT